MPYTDRNIVIRIPPPEYRDSVFIAMPFAQKYDQLYGAIVTALASTPLKSFRVDKNSGNVNFIEEILAKIRTARIVIVVLASDTPQGIPNPNVMYELGLARSIGKCILLLTTNINLIPSDLRDNCFLVFSLSNVNKQNFINELTIKINAADKMVRSDGLTAIYYDDIFEAQPGHWLFLDTALWNEYKIIIAFAKDVNNWFQILSANIEPLVNKALNLFNQNKPNYINDYQLIWKAYASNYNNAWNSFLIGLKRRQDVVDNAFSVLNSKHATCSSEALEKSFDFYKTINYDLEQFINIHSQSNDKSNKGLRIEEFDHLGDLYSRTINLSQVANNIIANSGSMMQNLIQVVQYK